MGMIGEVEHNHDIVKEKHDNIQLARTRYDILRIFIKYVTETKDKEWISTRVYNLILDAAEGKINFIL